MTPYPGKTQEPGKNTRVQVLDTPAGRPAGRPAAAAAGWELAWHSTIEEMADLIASVQHMGVRGFVPDELRQRDRVTEGVCPILPSNMGKIIPASARATVYARHGWTGHLTAGP